MVRAGLGEQNKNCVPGAAANTMNMAAAMDAPVAMPVADCNLAESDLKKAHGNPRVYRVIFLKVLLVPAISAIFLPWIPVERIYTLFFFKLFKH